MNPVNGLHQLTRDVYDGLDRVHWSQLKGLLKSPASFLESLKKKATPPMALGIAVHTAILEPAEFAKCAVWCGGVRRGKEWDAFKEVVHDRTVLTEAEHASALEIAARVRNNDQAAKYLRVGTAETTCLWDFDGIACKARIDWLCDEAIIDIKTTIDASPRGFGAQAARYSYLGQAAMYRDGVEAAIGKRLPFVLLAVEKELPFVVQAYRVPDELLLLGQTLYRGLLKRLVECREKNSWPGYAERELELTIPNWALMEENNNGGT